MYSFYRGESTDSEFNKNRDITSDVTKWDKVKAFLLALITAGISMKYNWSTKAKKEKYDKLSKDAKVQTVIASK